jgi:methionyl-tRNA synthetase
MTKYYVTTPIYYINDKPHIGHAYATILADVVARYHRQRGNEVAFSTGTDENSQKTIQAAEASGLELGAYTDAMAAQWEEVWKALNISYTRFVRTTESDHKKAVHEFIKRVEKSGDIYKGTYEGLYCTGCEEFKRESDLVDGKCPLHNRVPDKIKEDNYFFKLSKYQQLLLDFYKNNPDAIVPASRRNEVLSFIERGLEDFSISRPKKVWGIPWPDDKDQVVYVWFDALINYLTVAGFPGDISETWPADLHIVGKDITKFHSIYWPAMLMSANIEPAKQVLGTGFFTVEGQKISKSLGNAIDPLELIEIYGVDALRYYLLREIPLGSDGEFTRARFDALYNADLANELGNLVQRVAVMSNRYLEGKIGEIPPHSHDVSNFEIAMGELRFEKALEEIWALVKGLNQYLEEEKPWTVAKTDMDATSDILHHAISDILQIATLLLPFMPSTAQKIATTFANGAINLDAGVLFPKADTIEKTEIQIKG